MENFIEREYEIDLSATKNTAQLATELGSILEVHEAKGKQISLKLGELDLKQSQLLSIKALIESIDSSVVSVSTTSDMTEASAISLGIAIKSDSNAYQEQEEQSFHESISEHIEDLNTTFSDEVEESENEDLETEETENVEETTEEEEQIEETLAIGSVEQPQESFSNTEEIIIENIEKKELNESEILMNHEVQAALDKVLGVDKEKTQPNFVKTSGEGLKVLKNEIFEESITNERSSEGKYVLLDTDGITPEDMEENTDNTSDLQTLYLTQTLRSGQTVSYEGNIFIVGDTHPGSEGIATADITVWGILGGIAHAGSNGNVTAKVRALKLNPIQLRIAGLYSRRNDTINVPYVQRTNEFTPEEARINNKQIVVYKTLRRED